MVETTGVRTSGTCCRMCGSSDVECDEVQHGGVLHLAECRGCRHRWTWRGSASQVEPAPIWRVRSKRDASPRVAA